MDFGQLLCTLVTGGFAWIIGAVKGICYGNSNRFNGIFIIDSAKALVAGLVLELGANQFGASETLMWCLAWMVLSLTIVGVKDDEYMNIQVPYDQKEPSRTADSGVFY
jgi:hypothetical protein